MTDLDEQPVPETICPECGGDPSGAVTHRLSSLGYKHDDQQVVCADCGHTWICGVPIGEFDRPEYVDDLACECGEWRLVHRAGLTPAGNVTLHLKCPACSTFEIVARKTDPNGIALVGYPQTTGETAGCETYGYPDDATDDD